MSNYLPFSPIIGLGANLICQVCASRYTKGLGFLKSVYAGFAVGLLISVFIGLYCLGQASLPLSDEVAYVFVNVVTYFALGFGYFTFVNLGQTGRRIRISRELYESKNGLSAEEMLKRYSAKDIIEKRIKRLIGTGQIIYKGGRYYIGSPVMLFMARTIVAMKLIVLGKRSEFD